MIRIALSLTHSCNLDCDYCYAGRSFNRHMSRDVSRKIIDFAMAQSKPNERIEISFFGGEPLLRFDTIKDVVADVKTRIQQSPRHVILSITTNGTLLNDEKLAYFEQEGIDVCISIDGPKHIHDQHRVYRDGKGSFDDVIRNLKHALQKLSRIQVNAVFGPKTINSLPETIDLFLRLGVPVIHLSPDIMAKWNDVAREKLMPAYQQIADQYIESYQQGQEVAINLIDNKVILFLKGGYQEIDMCGMGKTQWAFAPSGNVYPCERFIGEDNDDKFQLGNILTGIDERRRWLIMHQEGNRNEECLTCELRPYCMNWCGCTNYYSTGHVNLAGATLCASERAAITASKRVLETLSRNDSDLFFTHILHYFQSERQSQSFQTRRV